MLLELEVEFTVGRYHGEEWPPSPARVFQALVAATHYGACGLVHQRERDEALRWLETLAPPEIFACDCIRGPDHIINYLPNNDDTLGINAHKRSAVQSFSSFCLVEQTSVRYIWQFEPEPLGGAYADRVTGMASLVTYIGRTGDLVCARGRVLPEEEAVQSDCRERWQPKERTGGRWLVPTVGFLDLLKRRYPRSVSAEPPDFTNTRQVDYECDDVFGFDAPIALLEMLRLDGPKLAFDPRDLRQPAGMVRNAMLRWVNNTPGIRQHFGPDQLARFLQGHKSAESNERSEGGHFAVVPLPSLNPPAFTADGWLRRVALVGYGVASGSDRELFEEVIRGLHGALLEDNGRPRGELQLLTPREQRRVLAPLTGPAKQWRSVTPVILTGRTRRGRSAEDCLARGLQQQGFPTETIESIATFSGPIVPTAQPARAYRVQGYLTTTPRVHAELLFRRRVRGPLVVGRGRFTGFGLLVPVSG